MRVHTVHRDAIAAVPEEGPDHSAIVHVRSESKRRHAFHRPLRRVEREQRRLPAFNQHFETDVPVKGHFRIVQVVVVVRVVVVREDVRLGVIPAENPVGFNYEREDIWVNSLFTDHGARDNRAPVIIESIDISSRFQQPLHLPIVTSHRGEVQREHRCRGRNSGTGSRSRSTGPIRVLFHRPKTGNAVLRVG